MKEGFTLEEFHCASNVTQPIRISSRQDVGAAPFFLMKKKHSEGTSTVRQRQLIFQKCRSGTGSLLTSHVICNTASTFAGSLQTIPRKSSLAVPFHVFIERCSTPDAHVDEERKLAVVPAGERSAGPPTAHSSEKTADSPFAVPSTFSEEQRLKVKLSEALSPSPFRREDPEARDATLERLVSAASPTKGFLFSQFYGTEIDAGSNSQWKLALKDYILHTLESICLIKKVGTAPKEEHNPFQEKPKTEGKQVRKSVK